MSPLRLVPLVPVLALAMTACGSSSKSSDAPVSTPDSSNASASQDATTSAVTGASPSLAAESAAPSSTGGGSTPDPCSLLTTAQIDAAVQGTVGDGKGRDVEGPLGGKSCDWSTSTLPIKTFDIQVRSDKDITVSGESTSVLFDQSRTTLGSAQHFVDLPGVGDKAYIGDSFAYVLKGDVLLITSTGLGTSDLAKTALKTLTTQAAANL